MNEYMIRAFRQGKRGNCVSIAVIKAAMAHYGPDNIFTNVTALSGGRHKILMRDGFETLVRPHEIDKATRHSRFLKGKDEDLREKAYFYFAAMAKRVLVEGEIDVFLGTRTLRGALRSLNNGENYTEGFKWLGLTPFTKEIPLDQIDAHENLVGVSRGHCYYITKGVLDNYGKPLPHQEATTSSFKTKTLVLLE